MTDSTPNIPVIALVGATASGKTATSMLLADELSKIMPVEILSADSRQVYRYLTIGTAKPTPAMLAHVPHHFVSIKNPDEDYSAGLYGTDAARTVQAIRNRGAIALVVGGSGLYVRALSDGLFEDDVDTSSARAVLERRLAKEGIGALYHELQEVDFVLAEKYNDLNHRRVIRALEYYHTTGTPLSQAHAAFSVERTFQTLYFGVRRERQDLYERINQRSKAMFAEGLVEETEATLAMGYAPTLNALNTVGYKEALSYLRGDTTRERAIELTQQSTRRYAKRQLTWFRHESRVSWHSGSPGAITQMIMTTLRPIMEST